MERYAWMDNLRVLMIVLVVILHTCVTYSGLGGWYYKENMQVDMYSTIFFAFYLTFTQAYFMSLLFMVSGYFTQRSLLRKGAINYSLGRLKRLGIPLLIFIFLIQPFTVMLAYPDLNIVDWYLGGLKDFEFIGWTGPLWFVEALLIFTLIYVLIFRLFIRREFKIKLKVTYLNVSMLILLITAVAFLLRLNNPIGSNFYNLQFSFFSAYVIMFAVGIIAFSAGIFEQITFKDGKRWLAISLGLGIPGWCMLIYFAGFLEGSRMFEGGMNGPAFFYALWESFVCVTFILALIGIFRYRLNIKGKLQQFLSDNAFGVFVFHAPVLVGISMLLKDFSILPVPKFFLVFTLAVPLSFLVSWLVRRIGVLRSVFS